MREPQYSLLADIQYDIELARQGKFALYGQRNIAREYRCKKFFSSPMNFLPPSENIQNCSIFTP